MCCEDEILKPIEEAHIAKVNQALDVYSRYHTAELPRREILKMLGLGAGVGALVAAVKESAATAAASPEMLTNNLRIDIEGLSEQLANAFRQIDAASPVSVKAYEAVGNGVIDDTDAIQAAFNALAEDTENPDSERTTKVIQFEAGRTYRLTRPIYVAKSDDMTRWSNVWVRGNGATLQMDTHDPLRGRGVGYGQAILVVEGQKTDPLHNIVIEGLTFQNIGDPKGDANDVGFWSTLNGVRVPYNRRQNKRINVGAAIHALNVFEMLVMNCRFLEVGIGVRVDSGDPTSSRIFFLNNHIKDWGLLGILVSGEAIIEGNYFEQNAPSLNNLERHNLDIGTSHAIYMTARSKHSRIVHNVIQGCKFYAVHIWGGTTKERQIIANNIFWECQLVFTAGSAQNSNIYFTNNLVVDCGPINPIAGAASQTEPESLEKIANSSVYIEGNIFSGTDPCGTRGQKIQGNCLRAQQSHVSLESGQVVVRNNVFKNVSGLGRSAGVSISVGSLATMFVVEDNLFTDDPLELKRPNITIEEGGLTESFPRSSIGILIPSVGKEVPIFIRNNKFFTQVGIWMDEGGNKGQFLGQTIIEGNYFQTGNLNPTGPAHQPTIRAPAGISLTRNFFHQKTWDDVEPKRVVTAIYITEPSSGRTTRIISNVFRAIDERVSYTVLDASNAQNETIVFRDNVVDKGGELVGTSPSPAVGKFQVQRFFINTPNVNPPVLHDTAFLLIPASGPGEKSIANFRGGYPGKIITISATGTVIVKNNSTIQLRNNSDFIMGSGDTLTLAMFVNGIWQEIARTS